MPKPKLSAVDARIGKRWRVLRRSRGMSQADLGSALGVSYQQIQKYETGRSSMRVATLLQCAQLFGVPPASLYERNPRTKPATAAADRKFDRYAASSEGKAVLKAFAAVGNAMLRRDLLALAKSFAA